MQFIEDNYESIAEAALIVPMADDQAAEAQSALERRTGARRGSSGSIAAQPGATPGE